MSTATPSSNQKQFDATTTACVPHDVDEEDPLGILRRVKVPGGHDHVDNTKTSSRRLLERPEELMRAAVDCCENRNPCEVIDAILRSSQAIRDRVSSRQVRNPRGRTYTCTSNQSNLFMTRTTD